MLKGSALSELDVDKLPLDVVKFSFVILRFPGELAGSKVKFDGSKRLVIEGRGLSPSFLLEDSILSICSASNFTGCSIFLSETISSFISPFPKVGGISHGGMLCATSLVSGSEVFVSEPSDDKPNFAIPDWSFAKPPPNMKSSDGCRTWELVLADPGNLASNEARVVRMPPKILIKF